MALEEYGKLHLPAMTAPQISFSHSVKVKTLSILTVINYILPCGKKSLPPEFNFYGSIISLYFWELIFAIVNK